MRQNPALKAEAAGQEGDATSASPPAAFYTEETNFSLSKVRLKPVEQEIVVDAP